MGVYGSLSGKRAVILGGSRGIGRAIALRLAAEGVHLDAMPEAERAEAVTARLAGVGFHVARHTHATVLGTNPAVDAASLAARLGHADPSFTARRYVHASDERARELARIAAGL